MSETRPAGMCKDCRVEPARQKPDGTLASRCEACAAQRNEEAKAARARRKRKGLCTYPGGCDKRAEEGKSACADHLEYWQAATAKHKAAAKKPKRRKRSAA